MGNGTDADRLRGCVAGVSMEEVHVDRISEFIEDIIIANGTEKVFTVRFNPNTDCFREKGMLSVEVILV